MSAEDLQALRDQWTRLYSQKLPQLAKSRDPAQPKWPVALDHCFARIILDNVIGRGEQQWDHVISRPAVRHMDAAQLRETIELAEEIASGNADLVILDQISLGLRGKAAAGKYGNQQQDRGTKRQREGSEQHHTTDETTKRRRDNDNKKQATLPFVKKEEDQQQPKPTKPPSPSTRTSAATTSSVHPNPTLDPDSTASLLSRIRTHPSLTPFRKRLYSTLLSVPRGTYTTYAALATYLSSSPRAVGNGMRNNPFAPAVPCHRVLASGGEIGGFGGGWGKDGRHAGEKVELLRGEGVRFDSRGKVRGPVFTRFVEGDLAEQEGGGGERESE